MSPSPKVIVQTFDNYAKSQLAFVQNVAELAAKPTYAECLNECHAVDILMPLTVTFHPTVRMNAVLALARLAANSEWSAKQMLCSKNLLSRLLGQIGRENKYYKKNCMSLVRNLCKHSSSNCQILLKECGGMEAITACMKYFDSFVREGALRAIGTIARQDSSHAHVILKSGILPQVITCLKEQQQSIKLHALTAIDEIAKHNEDLARVVVEEPSLPVVIDFLSPNCPDTKVQRSALNLIKNIVKHSLYLTENAIESNLFPDILLLMSHPDECTRNLASKVIRDIVKHSVQIAQMVVNAGGIASLLNVISCAKDLSSVPAVLALGYIAAMSPILASAVIQSQALLHLIVILRSDADKITKTATVWTLGMIGKHSAEHTRSVFAEDAVYTMIQIYSDSNLDNEGRQKCNAAIQQLLRECDDYDNLDRLMVPSVPQEIMVFILEKISKILPNNSKARRSFITNGHLKMIQSINPPTDSDLHRAIKAVNCCFPEDIIQMVSGDFPETVMKTVDKYVPQSECLFYNPHLKSDESRKTVMTGEESLFE